MRLTRGAVVGLGIVSGLAVALPGTAAPGNKYERTTATRECETGDVQFHGPIKLWPPNHKLVPISVVAIADDAQEAVTLTVTPTVTDTTGGDGGPNHDPDYTPEDPAGSGTGRAVVDLALRAERSGRGDGRTYTLHWTATFGEEPCTSRDAGQTPFVVTVPHDMRGGADWKK